MRFFILLYLLALPFSGLTATETYDFSYRYDINSIPEINLVIAANEALRTNKLVLMIFGGDWCGWSRGMDAYLDNNQSIKKELNSQFVILKVHYSPQNKNMAFFKKVLGENFHPTPYFAIYDHNGEILAFQDTSVLEQGNGYSDQAFLDFINKWKTKRKTLLDGS